MCTEVTLLSPMPIQTSGARLGKSELAWGLPHVCPTCCKYCTENWVYVQPACVTCLEATEKGGYIHIIINKLLQLPGVMVGKCMRNATCRSLNSFINFSYISRSNLLTPQKAYMAHNQRISQTT